MDYAAIFRSVIADTRYLANLDWGEPRSGHPEGTIRAHIAELETNLAHLQTRLSEVETWKLKLMIHAHDTFKADAKSEVPIIDPNSHASLANAFLAGYCDDADLLTMIQLHDEPFALWRQVKSKGACNPQRLERLLSVIHDWDLFLAFNIIDGCTKGKTREPLYWLFQEIAGKVVSRFTAADILNM